MKITYTDLKYIINESSKLLLTEISNNAIETIIKTYNPYLKDLFNLTLSQLRSPDMNFLEPILRMGLDMEEVTANPTMKVKDYLRLKILREFGINRDKGPVKYIRGIVRISCDKDIRRFDGGTSDENKAHNYKTFKNIIEYICKKNIDMSEDLNGLSFMELNKKIGTLLRVEAYNKWMAGKDEQFKNNVFGDYTVIPIYSHSDASQYAPYTSWCITQRQSYYDDYAGDGSQFYFCLKNGFEKLGKLGRGVDYAEAPFDDYGLSMVSVCIRPNGEPKCITTRWNHDHNGENNPRLRTLEQVEEMLGIPQTFFAVNKAPKFSHVDIPYLKANTDIDISEDITIERSYDNGYKLVKLIGDNGNYFTMTKDDEFVMDEWFRSYGSDSMTRSGKIEVWFYNETGEYVLWVEDMGMVTPTPIFSRRRPRVLFNEYNCFAVLSEDRKINIVNKNNERLLPYDDISAVNHIFSTTEYIQIRRRELVNIIDKNINFLWDEWVSEIRCDTLCEGDILLCEVRDDELGDYKISYTDLHTGKRITDDTYDDGEEFRNGVAKVRKGTRWNFINTKGEVLFDEWMISLIQYENVLLLHGSQKSALADFNGEILSGWWDYLTVFCGEYVHENFSKAQAVVALSPQEERYVLNVKGEIVGRCPRGLRNILLIEKTGQYIILYVDNGHRDLLVNILNPDGTYVFENPLKRTLNQDDPNIIKCLDQNQEEVTIVKKTGEIKRLGD